MSLPNLPFWSQSPKMQVVIKRGNKSKSIEPNQGYWRLKLIDMRLNRDWVFTSILHPALCAHLQFSDQSETIVVGPDNLGKLEGDVRRVFISPQSVSRIVPYTGFPCNVRLALVSVPGKELAASMLNVLSIFSGAIGRNDIKLAAEFADGLRKGLTTILGLEGATIKLGWTGEIGNFSSLDQSYILVSEPGKKPLDSSVVQFSGGRLSVLDPDYRGRSYLCFSVETVSRRADWRDLPNIRESLRTFNSLAGVEEQPLINLRVQDLIANIRNSPHLIEVQKEEISREIVRVVEKRQKLNRQLYRASEHLTGEAIANEVGEIWTPSQTQFMEEVEEENDVSNLVEGVSTITPENLED